MDIAVVASRIGEGHFTRSPWYLYRDRLEKVGFRIHLYEDSLAGFRTRHDAIILFVSFNWLHDVNFPSDVVMPYFQHLAIYRYEYPDCINIVLHHWDMIDVPFAVPLWRPGDPVLLRTPYYDRSRHFPLSNSVIGSYELDYAPKDRFKQHNEIRYMAGFIGKRNFRPPGNLLVDGQLIPNPHANWRERIANETSRVGIGVCADARTYSQRDHDSIISSCRIIVCPRGWGPQSRRHWDAWFSGKPVLTDRFCDEVEMIPGTRLKEGVHYLVFDAPEDIPDIVSEWTRPSRADDLQQIAENGRRAALSYDGFEHMLGFFRKIQMNTKLEHLLPNTE